jgi:predicted Zn-ribbon and HTH transcriptional regulator
VRSCAVSPLLPIPQGQEPVGSYWSERNFSRSLRSGRSLNIPTAATQLRDKLMDNLENDFSDAKDYRKPQTCPKCGTTFYKPPGHTIHCASECPKLRTVTIDGKLERVA